MKLAVFCATAIAVTVGSCSGIFDEQNAATLSESSADASLASYLVGITMKDSKDSSKNVELSIYRDSHGNPTCVGVSGFGTQKHYVQLKKHGSGEWKVDASDENAAGTYDRYLNAKSAQLLDITLHWTKERGDIKATAMSDAMTKAEHSRLEYLSASLNNGTLYEYQHDVDGKSSLDIGTLADTTPSQSDFNPTCDS